MEAQLNLAAPTINLPTLSGMMTDWISSSERYVRQPYHPASAQYMTYNIQNTVRMNDDSGNDDDDASIFSTKNGYRSNKVSLSTLSRSKKSSISNKNNVKSRVRKTKEYRRVNDEKSKKKQSVMKSEIGGSFIVGTSSHTEKRIHDNDNNNGDNFITGKAMNRSNYSNGIAHTNVYTDDNSTLVNSLWSSQPPRPGIDRNSSSSSSAISTNYIIIFSTLFFLVGTIGISGNVLVVYIVLSDGKMRRSMTNMMILNLALADSLVMLFGIPEIVMVLLDKGWQLGGVACSVNRTVLVCALYASVLTLVAVCIERYIAIVFPIKAHILCTKKRVIFVIGFIWLFSLACSTPTAVFNAVVHISNTQFCMTKFHDNRTKHDIYMRIYKYSESALFYMGPLIIQVVCYAVIGKRLFVDLDELHRGGGGGGGISSASRPNGRGPTRAFNEAMRARKGVVKMLMASVGIYCLSYSPHQILLIYNTFSSLNFDETWMYLVFTTILAYMNSAANPFLYCVFSDNFRSNFKRILHNCMPCKVLCCPCCESCSTCICCKDQKPQRPMTLHSYTEYTSLVRRNTQKQGQPPIITV